MIIIKRTEYDKRVINEAENNMKHSRSDIDFIMLKKHRKDFYTEQVINYKKSLALNKTLKGTQDKQLETEIDKVKTEIKKYRQKKWNEKGFKRKDIEFIKEAPRRRERSEPVIGFKEGIFDIAKLN